MSIFFSLNRSSIILSFSLLSFSVAKYSRVCTSSFSLSQFISLPSFLLSLLIFFCSLFTFLPLSLTNTLFPFFYFLLFFFSPCYLSSFSRFHTPFLSHTFFLSFISLYISFFLDISILFSFFFSFLLSSAFSSRLVFFLLCFSLFFFFCSFHSLSAFSIVMLSSSSFHFLRHAASSLKCLKMTRQLQLDNLSEQTALLLFIYLFILFLGGVDFFFDCLSPLASFFFCSSKYKFRDSFTKNQTAPQLP